MIGAVLSSINNFNHMELDESLRARENFLGTGDMGNISYRRHGSRLIPEANRKT